MLFKFFNIIVIFYYFLLSWNEMFICVVSLLVRLVFKEIVLMGRILLVMVYEFNIFFWFYNIG